MRFSPSDPSSKGYRVALTQVLDLGKHADVHAARSSVVFADAKMKATMFALVRAKLKADAAFQKMINEQTDFNYTLGAGYKDDTGEVHVPCTIYFKAA